MQLDAELTQKQPDLGSLLRPGRRLLLEVELRTSRRQQQPVPLARASTSSDCRTVHNDWRRFLTHTDHRRRLDTNVALTTACRPHHRSRCGLCC